MINIITGETNSGKSTKFMLLFSKETSAIGLFSKKLCNNQNKIIGYNLVLLPNKEEYPFIILKESVHPVHKDNYLYQGRFAFIKSTFEIGEKYILDNLSNHSVWIDEVGSLELKGTGYSNLIKKLIGKNINLTITIKSNLLEKVIANPYLLFIPQQQISSFNPPFTIHKIED